MATPAQLMETISATTGVPLATVIDIDRKLVKAGLRTKGGRGFSAARMTSLDAAHLLTAMLGAAQSNEAALAVERYSRTRVDKESSSEGLFGTADLDDLAALPARHRFTDALAAVISSAAGGALKKIMGDSCGDRVPSIEVFAFARVTRGRIRIAGLPNQLTASIEYVPIRGAASSKTGITGDLEQSRRLTERTILPVATLLSQEDGHERG
jgi:hypothetical protein